MADIMEKPNVEDSFKSKSAKFLIILLYGILIALVALLFLFLLSLTSDSVAFLGFGIRTLEQASQLAMPFLFIPFFVITLLLPLILIFKREPGKTVTTDQTEQKKPFCLSPKIILVISIIVVVILMSERYLRYTLPTGGDTPFYVISFNDIAAKGISLDWVSRLTATRIFSIIFSPLLLLNLSGETIIKLLPSILCVFYVLSTYNLFRRTNKKLASLSSLAAALSATVLVLSSQLYANFFAISLMLLFFAFYVESLEVNSKKNIILAALCQFILLQVYIPAWLITAGVVFVFLTISTIIVSKRLQILKTTMVVYFPSIIILVVGPFLLRQIWDYDLAANYYFSGSGLSLNNIGTLLPAILQISPRGGYDFQPFLMENSLILFLATIGILLIIFKATDLSIKPTMRNFIIAWAFVPSMLLPFFSTGGFRYTLYYPIPILVSIVFFFLAKRFSRVHFERFELSLTRIKKRFKLTFLTKEAKALFLLGVICLLLLSFSLIRLRESPLIYPSYKNYAEELYWVHENYDPKMTIICVGDYVYKPPAIYDSDVGWVQAVTQAYIYVGKLAELLSGNLSHGTEPWLNTPPSLTYDSFNQIKILVLSRQGYPTFYSPDIIEAQILKQVHPNVFEVKQMTSTEESNWIKAWYTYNETGDINVELPTISLYDSAFDDGWKTSTEDTIHTIGQQSVKITINSTTSGWKPFYADSRTNPILPLNSSWAVIKVNYSQLPAETRFLFCLWDGKRNVATIYFPSSGSNGWHAYSISFNSTLVDLIEISFYAPSTPVSFEYELAYLVLLK
jgi:hypothetical protein